jgi:hypothetical protein
MLPVTLCFSICLRTMSGMLGVAMLSPLRLFHTEQPL